MKEETRLELISIADEPKLMYTNHDAITYAKRSSETTLPYFVDIVKAYNEIPGARPLDNELFQSIFIDLDKFIQDCRDYWYETTHGETHRTLGITKAKGMGLVDDQLPDLQAFDDAVMAYKDLFNSNGNSWMQYAVPQAYEINEAGDVVISQKYLENQEELSKFYLVFVQEHDLLEKLTTIGDSINKVRDMLPPYINGFDNLIGTGAPKVMNFNFLYEIFNIVYPRWETDPEHPVFTPKIEFLRKMQQHYRNLYQQQASS